MDNGTPCPFCLTFRPAGDDVRPTCTALTADIIGYEDASLVRVVYAVVIPWNKLSDSHKREARDSKPLEASHEVWYETKM